MKWDRMILKTGALAIVSAIVLRLAAGPVGAEVARWMGSPAMGAVLLFLGTGRLPVLKVPEPTEAVTESPTTSIVSPTEERTLPVFSASDVPALHNTSSYTVDLEPMLYEMLGWDLTIPEPTVLILHTHTTESYADVEDYRSMEQQENMVAIGEVIAQELTQAGICVIHDRTIHDYPSYNGSYTQSRKTAEQYLEEYPTIQVVLDIHRDAIEDKNGNQLSMTAQSGAAQLMLVVGTDAGGYYHPNWRENLSAAVKLYARLEQLSPGICRPVSLRASRFNQDLCPGMLIVEIGAAGNTMEQAIAGAKILAQGIIDLRYGS